MVCTTISSFIEDLEWKVNSLCCEEHEKNLSLELVPWYDPPLCTYTCLPVDTRVGYTVTNVGALPIYRTYLECSAKRAHTHRQKHCQSNDVCKLVSFLLFYEVRQTSVQWNKDFVNAIKYPSCDVLSHGTWRAHNATVYLIQAMKICIKTKAIIMHILIGKNYRICQKATSVKRKYLRVLQCFIIVFNENRVYLGILN